MKLALVIERLDPGGGGAERSTCQIATELARRDHDVTVLAGRAEGDLASLEPVKVVGSPAGDTRSGGQLRAFVRWAEDQINQGDYDVSLGMTTMVAADVIQPRSGTVIETQARNLAMRSSAPARWLKRCLLAVSPKQRVLRQLEHRAISGGSVRRFASLSEYVTRQLVEHYGVDRDRIDLVPNAAVIPQLSAEEASAARQELRARENIGEDQMAFLFAAFNPRLKGFEPLMRATSEVISRGHDAVLVLAGRVGAREQAWIRRAGIESAVRVVGPTDAMARWYRAADVTVLPTFYDPASKVVIESLLAGTPAITTRYNGAADWVMPEGGPVRGRVIDDPADVTALADAMAELCGNEAR
ncbi:MAG: glycosyltransferase family 4 protein, partial [Phycisphaeraceae bacterium]|nr:glycosyltransferase family 4 protein [Phycisphaeraceae bacterium]